MSGFLQVPVKNLTGTSEIFGMLPCDILSRTDLSPGAKLVLAAMGVEAAGTCFISASDEVLGRLSGLSRPTVLKGRAELERAGLIQPAGKREQQIQPYKIMHPRYVSSRVPQGAAGERPKDLRRRREWVICPVCLLKRPGLLKVGYCRSCKSERKTEGIARKVAREEIAAQRTA